MLDPWNLLMGRLLVTLLPWLICLLRVSHLCIHKIPKFIHSIIRHLKAKYEIFLLHKILWLQLLSSWMPTQPWDRMSSIHTFKRHLLNNYFTQLSLFTKNHTQRADYHLCGTVQWLCLFLRKDFGKTFLCTYQFPWPLGLARLWRELYLTYICQCPL